MKIFKKALLIICIIIMIIGMFLLGRRGLNYVDGYSKSMLVNTIKEYYLYLGIATVLILIYFTCRYSKKGIVKVLITSILVIAGTIIFAISVLEISTIAVSRMFFPIMLALYGTSIVVLSAYFEEKK